MTFRLSAVTAGTYFEDHCRRLLHQSLCMSLDRVGGAHDGGVDLRGWWYLPTAAAKQQQHSSATPKQRIDAHDLVEQATRIRQMQTGGTTSHDPLMRRIRVLAQCKNSGKRSGPQLIREMEGVARRSFEMLDPIRSPSPSPSSSSLDETAEPPLSLGSRSLSDWLQPAPPSPDDDTNPAPPTPVSMSTIDSVLTIACHRTGFSKSAVTEVQASRVPMMLLQVPFDPSAYHAWHSSQTSLGLDHDGQASAYYPLPLILAGAVFNRALIGSRGVLGDELEIRKEFKESSEGQQDFGMGLWWR